MSTDSAELAVGAVDLVDEDRLPNLLSVLMQINGWTTWSRFQVHFDSAARRAAKEFTTPRLAMVTASKLTMTRWMAGTQHPRGDAAIVLEYMLGFSVHDLLAPAPRRDVVAVPRPPSNASLQALRTIDFAWQTSTLRLGSPGSTQGGVWHLHGRDLFDGTLVPIQVYEAREQGDVVLIGPEDHDHLRAFVQPTRRALLLASTAGTGGEGVSLLDATLARQHLARDPNRILPVPRAYRLDPLTYAIVWAALNVDDALCEDDHALAAAELQIRPILEQSRSAVGRSAFPDLSRVGSAWLGSHFCLSYTDRRLGSRAARPTASWSRLRTGEEYAMWLLFRGEQRALAAAQAHDSPADALRTRVLCIPKEAVEENAAHAHERLLVFLAATAMELHGLGVAVCTDLDYADLDAFDLVPGQAAVVASWPRSDGIWHAEEVTRRPQLLMYAEAIRHAVAESVVTGSDSPARLRSLAQYLQLDWPWLVRRCRELGEAGVAGMLRARSRELTFASLDRALAFVGTLSP